DVEEGLCAYIIDETVTGTRLSAIALLVGFHEGPETRSTLLVGQELREIDVERAFDILAQRLGRVDERITATRSDRSLGLEPRRLGLTEEEDGVILVRRL